MQLTEGLVRHHKPLGADDKVYLRWHATDTMETRYDVDIVQAWTNVAHSYYKVMDEFGHTWKLSPDYTAAESHLSLSLAKFACSIEQSHSIQILVCSYPDLCHGHRELSE